MVPPLHSPPNYLPCNNRSSTQSEAFFTFTNQIKHCLWSSRSCHLCLILSQNDKKENRAIKVYVPFPTTPTTRLSRRMVIVYDLTLRLKWIQWKRKGQLLPLQFTYVHPTWRNIKLKYYYGTKRTGFLWLQSPFLLRPQNFPKGSSF